MCLSIKFNEVKRRFTEVSLLSKEFKTEIAILKSDFLADRQSP